MRKMMMVQTEIGFLQRFDELVAIEKKLRPFLNRSVIVRELMSKFILDRGGLSHDRPSESP